MAVHFHEHFLFSSEEREEAQPLFQSAINSIRSEKAAGTLGFTKLPYAWDDVAVIEQLARDVAAEFSTVILIGIGGSDLGTRAVHRALNHQFYNSNHAVRGERPRLFFLGDTTDPVDISEVTDMVDFQDTAIVMISKSGNTVEQMSTFIFLRQRLIDAVGDEAAKRHIITVTDAENGTLRDITTREGYRSLAVPPDVGGRFSVFSAVGLFPLAMVGIDIHALLDGAAHADQEGEDTAAEYALLQYLSYIKRGQHIQVMMPYTYSIRELGFWFRQLWAESLGKRLNRQGEEVNSGPTPIAALGPTDQHSQVQLFREGPRDKTFTFITVLNPAVNFSLPEAFSDIEGVRYLAGHSFNEILLAEQRSTADALQEVGRPTCVFELDSLDAWHVGYLMYLLELATALGGVLHSVNTFDQPGVERGKQLMYDLLGRDNGI